MDRANAFTINVKNWSNSDFWQLLSEHSKEDVLFNIQPQFKTDGIFWFDDVPKELFKYSECFNWLHGSVRLWCNGVHVTKENYITMIEEGTETTPPKYSYTNWEGMTSIPPVSDETEFNL